MTYELLPDVALVTICDEYYLVAAGEARGKVPDILGVTAPGAYFWGLLERGLAVPEIIRQAAEDYGVPQDTAKTAFFRFADSLRDTGYLLSKKEPE